MKRKLTVLCVLLILLILPGYRFSLSPTIQPNDVLINGDIKSRLLLPSQERFIEGDYVIDVSLNKKTKKALSDDNKGYISDICVYTEGIHNIGWDFYKGLDKQGYLVGGEGFQFGINGRTLQVAADELRRLGILTSNSEEQTNIVFNNSVGFSYSGNKFPGNVRLHFANNTGSPEGKKAFLIYSHYEVKWGKDLSWAKVIPLKVSS